ncbi:hypothetical protein BT63DRAFT_153261 [Microthyrium microscopicum]|uniref:Uncharacterized protein n=1 Tax=Microthyrium microscopicum TaxID=703497 RepID=A0A6A6UM48_9PEZI|nr:hypothetical protein BT63DRAFT_153261 [Microthyrium microscopicum]
MSKTTLPPSTEEHVEPEITTAMREHQAAWAKSQGDDHLAVALYANVIREYEANGNTEAVLENSHHLCLLLAKLKKWEDLQPHLERLSELQADRARPFAMAEDERWIRQEIKTMVDLFFCYRELGRVLESNVWASRAVRHADGLHDSAREHVRDGLKTFSSVFVNLIKRHEAELAKDQDSSPKKD